MGARLVLFLEFSESILTHAVNARSRESEPSSISQIIQNGCMIAPEIHLIFTDLLWGSHKGNEPILTVGTAKPILWPPKTGR